MENILNNSLLTILITFVVSMLVAPILIKILYKYGVVRQTKDFSSIVGERYLKQGTPIMGGLLVVIIVSIFTLIFNWNERTIIAITLFLISASLGGIDDLMNIFGKKDRIPRSVSKQILLIKVHKDYLFRFWLLITLPWNIFINIFFILGSFPGRGLQAGEKILVQAISGGIFAYWFYIVKGIDSLWIPFYGDLYLGILMPILLVFTIIAMTNAVNIADGMDGLSSGTLISAFAAFLILSIFSQDIEMSILNSTVIGALLAYLYFNIKPARIEMGDVGSLALGSLITTVSISQDKLILLPIIGAIFVIEIGSSLVQGIYRRIFGHRLIKMAPLHLHFNIIGWSEEKTVMRFWLFAILFAIFGIWLGLQ